MFLEHNHVRRAFRMQPVVSELRSLLRPGCRMVEVGSLTGESSFAWAASGIFSRVYCVDAWDPLLYLDSSGGALAKWSAEEWAEAESTFNQLASVFPVLRKVKGLSVDCAAVIAAWYVEIDYIYIDAFHTYPALCQDIRAWFPLLSAGGIVGGHDYSETFPGVMRAVDELLGPVKTFQDRSWLALETRGGDRLLKD